MLQAQGLAKHYGEVAVFRDVSLAVAAGEFVAIVGESGVGKSTLLNCLAGLDHWDAGSIAVDGIDLASLDDEGRALLRRGKLGFVFQACSGRMRRGWKRCWKPWASPAWASACRRS